MVRVMLALVRPWSLYTTDYINIMNCMLFLVCRAVASGDGLFWFCVADKRNPIAGSRVLAKKLDNLLSLERAYNPFIVPV